MGCCCTSKTDNDDDDGNVVENEILLSGVHTSVFRTLLHQFNNVFEFKESTLIVVVILEITFARDGSRSSDSARERRHNGDAVP